MKIKKLEFEAFRGFNKSVGLELHPQVNVFVGLNGAGKTSILDLAAGMLSYFIARFMNDRRQEIHFSKEDVNDESELLLSSAFFVSMEVDTLEKESFTVLYNSNRRHFNINDRNFSRNFLKWLRFKRESNSYPMLIYYHAHRMMKGKASQKEKQLKNPLAVLYENALGQDLSSFESFESWFRQEKYYENQMRLKKDINFESDALAAIELALNTAFKVLTEQGVSYCNLDLYYEVNEAEPSRWSQRKEPFLSVEKNGKLIKLNKLSDGEKMLLVTIADIARRLSLTKMDQSAEEILVGTGIVLIDEIELHLHPAWQRKIISVLVNIFPNIQFILSTHSPQVLSGVSHESIFSIDNFQVKPLGSPTKGRDSNSILWDVYGVRERPEQDRTIIEEFYALFEQDPVQEDQLKELLTKIEKSYGAQDKEVLRAQTFFDLEFGN